MKIELEFKNEYDVSLLEKFPDYNGLLRVVANIEFKSGDSWTAVKSFIDTGGHTSILPSSVWNNIDVKILGDYFVKGVNPKEECILSVKVAKVIGRLVDENGNTSEEIEFRTYLAPVENIHVILGFKDLLEKFKINIDFPNRSCYLEV